MDGQKVSSRKRNCFDQVDFCPFRGPDAPFALRDLITTPEGSPLRLHYAMGNRHLSTGSTVNPGDTLAVTK